MAESLLIAAFRMPSALDQAEALPYGNLLPVPPGLRKAFGWGDRCQGRSENLFYGRR